MYGETISVDGFSAGNAKTAFAEHDEQWYIQQEQNRLNALGY